MAKYDICFLGCDNQSTYVSYDGSNLQWQFVQIFKCDIAIVDTSEKSF